MYFRAEVPPVPTHPWGTPGAQGTENTMAPTQQENAALVRGFLTDVIAGGDTAAVDVFLAKNVIDHNLVFGNSPGREPVTALGWRVLAATDVDLTIHDVVADDDRVAARGTVTGTHCESLLDLAPTGISFEIAYVWFCRIENDRIAEVWSLPDGLSLVQQLGAIPELPANRSFTDSTEHS